MIFDHCVGTPSGSMASTLPKKRATKKHEIQGGTPANFLLILEGHGSMLGAPGSILHICRAPASMLEVSGSILGAPGSIFKTPASFWAGP